MDHFAGKKNLIPKIQTVTWDSDKNPDGFHKWSVTIASIVQTMPGGRSLETFLDLKLQQWNRFKGSASMESPSV